MVKLQAANYERIWKNLFAFVFADLIDTLDHKELQVIMGTWKLIVGYLYGPWNKPYGPIQTPLNFIEIYCNIL